MFTLLTEWTDNLLTEWTDNRIRGISIRGIRCSVVINILLTNL